MNRQAKRANDDVGQPVDGGARGRLIIDLSDEAEVTGYLNPQPLPPGRLPSPDFPPLSRPLGLQDFDVTAATGATPYPEGTINEGN